MFGLLLLPCYLVTLLPCCCCCVVVVVVVAVAVAVAVVVVVVVVECTIPRKHCINS